MDLKTKRCVPCEGGVPKLDAQEIESYLRQAPGWAAAAEKLHKTFQFADFAQAMQFINRMATLAEAEGHHPDFCVHYSRVELTLWTHAIGGLSENDFILAAKLDALLA